ncbi:BMP family lipoprotein [Streptococcus danieliae]|uniref:BMP family protein n=2 Tax=Streptococcus danieliae TaxID=747656 RepID=A0A7Z0M7B0_9STRE|nr:BMP family protein [Streptococcus danieliae]MBF0699619.1 BMP family protein [Streptococcus danieliae]NYS96795.1 BMP family protein [Streptococcus danieliae]
MNKKQWFGIGLTAAAALTLVACGNRSTSENADAKTDLKAVIVTDTGGVDDKSFNQSAWEGLMAWGKENGLSEGSGISYIQSQSESDYANNLEQAASSGNQLVFGIGFALRNAVESAAKDRTDTNYVIIDEVIENMDNVASATFADNEAAYLAGVAAAKTTKTKEIGFIGGMESEVITRFEKGFEAGVKSVDPSINVRVDYAGSFSDAAKGKSIAQAQYSAGVDVIYQAAGGTGVGVFKEAKDLNETKDEAEKVWVVGVDRDQKDEGNYKSKDGKESNFVLASTLKEVGAAVADLANQAKDGKFPGGKHLTYGLKDKGVDLAETNLSDDAKAAVKEAKDKIVAGDLEVPAK